jgi:hypothetical protein
MSADIITRLRASLDEIERLALDAARTCAADLATADRHDDRSLPPYDGSHWSNDYDHVFVLADIAAKRKLIDLHRPIRQRSTGSGGGTIEDCAVCDAYPAQYPCATVRLLAEAYGITEE